MTTEDIKTPVINKALIEVQVAADRVAAATGAKDVFQVIEKFCPVGVNSLRQIEEQMNDPGVHYQTLLELRDRWVSGWKDCLSKYLRINNANAQLAAELAERKQKKRK